MPDKRFQWLTPDKGEGFQIEAFAFAGATIMNISAPPVRVTQLPAADCAPLNERFHLIVHREGHGHYRARGQSFDQLPGDIVLMDAGKACEAVFPQGSRLLRWALPEAEMAGAVGHHDRAALCLLRSGQAFHDLVGGFACRLARQAHALDPAAKPALLAHLAGLVAMAVARTQPPGIKPQGTYRAMQRRRVIAFIEENYRDPDISIERAAGELGMSKRWIYALLEDTSFGFAELVARRRLTDSLRLLMSPSAEGMSIAEIAFQSGFRDLSTFYRRFRCRFGTTPKAVRRRGAPGGPTL